MSPHTTHHTPQASSLKPQASLLFAVAFAFAVGQVRGESSVAFQTSDDQVLITVDAKPVATYVFADPKISRPYFAHVKTPVGIQVTRHHPPIEGRDRTDHDTMHPGIWMAFGDLDGADFWRNKSHVVHRRFPQPPEAGEGKGSFVEAKVYQRSDSETICSEQFRCTFHVRPTGYLIEWDSTFVADRDFYFGDQEEMGLGIRVATPIMGIKAGRLLDSEGRVGERELWGKAARWCDYAGEIDGRHVGLTLFAHPDNFRASWLHARDYGFVAMNPFGREAMKQGARSKIFVKSGQRFRLRYGVLIHSAHPDLSKAYADYLELTR